LLKNAFIKYIKYYNSYVDEYGGHICIDWEVEGGIIRGILDSLIFLACPLFLHSSKILTFDQKRLGRMTQRERDQVEAD
jgi:hypothetical protein